jgi:hypothetical protein
MENDTVSERKKIFLYAASAIIFLYLLFILLADIANQLFRSPPNQKPHFEMGLHVPYDGFFFLVLILTIAFFFVVRFFASRVGGIQKAASGNEERGLAMLAAMLFGTVILEEAILFALLSRGIGECFDNVISPCAGDFDMRTFFDVTLPLGKTTVFSFLLVFPTLNRVVVLFLFFVVLVYTSLLHISSKNPHSKSSAFVVLNVLLLILISAIFAGTDFVMSHPLIGPMLR